jgi:hypothetical protein
MLVCKSTELMASPILNIFTPYLLKIHIIGTGAITAGDRNIKQPEVYT